MYPGLYPNRSEIRWVFGTICKKTRNHMCDFTSGFNYKSFRKHFLFRNDLSKDPEILEKCKSLRSGSNSFSRYICTTYFMNNLWNNFNPEFRKIYSRIWCLMLPLVNFLLSIPTISYAPVLHVWSYALFVRFYGQFLI